MSSSYSAYKSSNLKFSTIYKINPDINLYHTKHKYINNKRKIFKESVHSLLPLSKQSMLDKGKCHGTTKMFSPIQQWAHMTHQITAIY